MDNASYHCVPDRDSICPDSFTTKKQATDFCDRYGIPYRAGRAPTGDSLVQIIGIIKVWLVTNAALHNIIYDIKTYCQHDFNRFFLNIFLLL